MSKFIWVEKYRPTKVEDCVLPERLKRRFEGILESDTKSFPNMLFYGGPGIGKTTVARAICNETDHDVLFINGSKDSGIDTLRTTVQTFASTVSLHHHRKCVIIDEAEYLNQVSTQPALRGFIEEFSGNCSFIFTCNHQHKLIRELHSRFTAVDFNLCDEERKPAMAGVFKVIKSILTAESVGFEDRVLAQHVSRYFPDYRRIIMELQAYSTNSGKIDIGILSSRSPAQKGYQVLTDTMRIRDFDNVHSWVNNTDYDPAIYSDLLDYWHTNKLIKPNSIAHAVLTLCEYESKAIIGSPRLQLLGCLVDIMSNVEFI